MTVEDRETARQVEAKLAAARAAFEQIQSKAPVEPVRHQIPQEFEADEASADCPICASPGVAGGTYDVEWDYERLVPGSHHPMGTMWFDADEFMCRVCGLQLDSSGELESAGMVSRWTVDFDPLEYVPEIDEDVAYEAWRNRQCGRIG